MATEIWVSGPHINITLHAPGSAFPFETLEGTVDTGASVICVDRRIALRLGLKAVNRKSVQIADGSLVQATIYIAEMVIPELKFRELVEIFAVSMPNPSPRVLLGRSFLKNFILTYNGSEGLFHWYRPLGGGFSYGIADDE